MIPYNISFTGGEGDTVRSTVSFYLDGRLQTIHSDSPQYDAVCHALQQGEDPTMVLDGKRMLVKLDDRVAIEEAQVIFDGAPIHDAVADTLIRYYREGRDTNNIVEFLKRLQKNPSEHSRAQLFDWVETRNLTIDEEGYIIGYKGVREDLTSVHPGPATVNGEPFEGNVPNDIGSVIELDRELVNDNPYEGCSTGLHVGSYAYASGFGRITVLVRVDPADVVSVPSDSGFAKMRCCRYEVLEVHEGDLHKVRERYEPEAKREEAVVPPVEEIFEGQLDENWIGKIKRFFRGHQ